MVHQGPSDEHVLMDARGAVAMSGIVVVSTEILVRSMLRPLFEIWVHGKRWWRLVQRGHKACTECLSYRCAGLDDVRRCVVRAHTTLIYSLQVGVVTLADKKVV
jgi:hypothetical protein